jgi:O-antigen/teichoic acid export membrane protein
MNSRARATGSAAGATGVADGGRGKHAKHRKSHKSMTPTLRHGAVARVLWWLFANTASAGGGTVLIGLVLARMIGPHEFGTLAVVVVALLAVRSLNQFGVSQAPMAWRGDPGLIAATITTLSLVSSAAIYAGCYAAAPAFAKVMGAPAAAPVIRTLALSVIISAVGAAPAAMLQRRSPRALKVLVDQADNWTGVLVTVGLAATGHGLISLAWGRIAGSAVSTLLLIMFAPQGLRIGFRPGQAPAMLGAWLSRAGSQLLLFGIANADLIVVGRMLSTTDLGWYLLALCLASWPVALCSQPVRDIAPTVFERFRVAPRVAASTYVSSANLLACLTVPACVVIISSAASVIRLIYGPAWAPGAHALLWLAPVAALRALYELTRHYLSARTSWLAVLSFQAFFSYALVLALVVGVSLDGIIGAGIAQVAVYALFLVPIYLREMARVGTGIRVVATRLTARLALMAIVGWIVLGIRHNMVASERVEFTAALIAAPAVMGLLAYRMRTVLRAARRVAAAARPPFAWNAIALPLEPIFGPPLYPVLNLVPLPRPPPEQLPSKAEEAADGGDQADLGRKVRSGARWSMLNTVVLRVANFATSVVLARTVFGPEAFGLYAVSQVILAVLQSANELGVSLAVVRWEGEVRDFAGTVYTLAVASSTLMYAGLFAAAPRVARLLGSPHATGMVRVLCLCVIIDGLACVPLALLTRTFAQRRLMLVQCLNFVVSTGVTLWLAFAGDGAISFAWGSVAGTTVALVTATIAAPFFVLPGWNSSQARGLLRFGLPLAGASLLMLGVFNVDSAIVGAALGPAALGLYQLAFNISSWPSRSISEAVQRISFAGFSRVADSPQQLADVFARALGLVMGCAVPACVLLAVLAEPLIRAVYGARWTPAAPVLTLLAILGLLRVAYQLIYDCLAAAGKRPALLAVQGWWLAALIPVLLIAARTHGIVGVGAGHILVAGPLVAPAFLWALSRCQITLRSVLAACMWPALGGTLMIVVAEVVLHYLGDGLAGLVAAGVAGLVVYSPAVFPLRGLLRRPTSSRTTLTEAHAA